eukprot:scaffold11310_cov107-Isochrysis_galbana.AAC.11
MLPLVCVACAACGIIDAPHGGAERATMMGACAAPPKAAKSLTKRPAVRGGAPARRPAVGGEPQQLRAPGGGAAG